MRHAALLVLLAIAGCTRFEHPIAPESGSALDPALIGDWSGENAGETISVSIWSERGSGKVTVTSTEAGHTDPEHYSLITTRIGSEMIASVKSLDEADATWFYLRYEVSPPDVLRASVDNDDFWMKVVEDQMITGRIEKGENSTRAVVTAGPEELRHFVQGYGSVIFKADTAFEFHRLRR